uniref:Uncharacterized protein n=1 Tax=Ascaris lumbricoides TaxID=6252 RepID=A0A0M3I192_ASCLU
MHTQRERHVSSCREALKDGRCLPAESRSDSCPAQLTLIMTTATVTYHELPPLTSWASEPTQTHVSPLPAEHPPLTAPNPVITPQQFLCNQTLAPYRTGK